MISCDRFRFTFGRTLLLFARQSHAQLLRNLPRNLFLNGEDVRELPAVLLTPQLRPIGDIHQFRLHDQSVAALQNFARQDCLHAEFAPDLLRVCLASFVAKDGRARHDAQPRQL